MRLSLFNCCLVTGLLSFIRSEVQLHGSSNVTEGTLLKLPRYNISSITVSGLSSGGYMAVQVHVAHSIIFSGAAIFAAVSWMYCRKLNGITLHVCLLPCNRVHFIARRASLTTL